MKRIGIILAFILLLPTMASAQLLIDAPTVPHKFKCNAQTPASSITTCAAGTPTAGNLLIVFAATNSATVTQTISSNNGACTRRGRNTGQNPDFDAWECAVTATTATTITDTLSAGNTVTSLEVYEAGNAAVFDVSGSSTTGSSTSSSSGATSATTVQTDLVFAGLAIQGSKAATSGPSLNYLNGDTGTTLPSLYTATTVTGLLGSTPSSTWGWTGAAGNDGLTLAYKSATQAPGSTHGTPASGMFVAASLSCTGAGTPALCCTGTGTGTCSTTTMETALASTTNLDCNVIILNRSTQTSAVSLAGWTNALSTNGNAAGNCTAMVRTFLTGDTANPVFTWTGAEATGSWVSGAITGLNGCQIDGTPTGQNAAAATVAQAPSQLTTSLDMLVTAFCALSATTYTNFTPFNSAANGSTSAGGSIGEFAYPITGPSTPTAPTAEATTSNLAYIGMSIPLGMAATASATPTVTATPTPTVTATLTPTPSATATTTATATLTPTPSATPTLTATPSLTPTPSNTPTATTTATASATATGATATPTALPCSGVTMGKPHSGLHSCGGSL